MGTPLRTALSVLLATGLAAGGVLATADPAAADARVTVTVTDRPSLGAVADTTYLTELTVSGSGFQSIANGFGGIYVLFGTVSGAWQPSKGGITGTNYQYVYDNETNPVGYQLFVSYPGSSTAYANNGGYLAADGTWSATIRIPGAHFQAYDRDGNVSTIDCTVVQCGIITIGAHGVINSSNETFTPITFTDIYTASDNKQVITSSPGDSVAIAPTTIGGRPATIPATRTDADLVSGNAGGVTATTGSTRITVTVPGADPENWLGITFNSDPVFVGWFKPSSTGEIDVNIPGNLTSGEHALVVTDEADDLIGWTTITYTATTENSSSGAPTASEPSGVAAADPEISPLLIGAVIGAGVLAVASIVLLIVIARRTRPTPAQAKGQNTTTEGEKE